jgi:predicted DCC family thiol-disulfide oxidoreductase YuxK
MQNLPQHKKIILFDGLCNLCDASVQFIIKRDSNDVFRFVSLQSNLGQQIVQYLKIDTQKVDSIVLYNPEKKTYLNKSEAVFEIIKSSGGIFYCLLIFRLIPIAITNKIYDFIARNRYRWFGKKKSCLVPTKELESKFLK